MGDYDTTPEFHETLLQRLTRWVLGCAYALRPQRLSILPRLWWLTLVQLFTPKAERHKLPARPQFHSERGLVGISDDLSVAALVANYSRGFFPVCHVGPMKWWCPEVRSVIDPADTHVTRHVRKQLRQRAFTVTIDRDFAAVIRACARPRPGKVPLTWITPRVMRAYWELHKAGYAHSVEVWDETGRLVGGLYGLAIGKVYFGESQFSTVTNASKVATAVLHRQLVAWGYRLCDAKWVTPHLASFGFTPMTRDRFLAMLQRHVNEPGRVGHWRLDPVLDLDNWPAMAPARETSSLKVA